MKKIKKLRAGELQIEVDCSRLKKLRKILTKAFPNDWHGMKHLPNPSLCSFYVSRCEVHEHMWMARSIREVNVKSIKLSQYGKNGDSKNQ